MDWKLIWQMGLLVFWGIQVAESVRSIYNGRKMESELSKLPNPVIFILTMIIVPLMYVLSTILFGLVAYGLNDLIGFI